AWLVERVAFKVPPRSCLSKYCRINNTRNNHVLKLNLRRVHKGLRIRSTTRSVFNAYRLPAIEGNSDVSEIYTAMQMRDSRQSLRISNRFRPFLTNRNVTSINFSC